jgi:hypothetical protein
VKSLSYPSILGQSGAIALLEFNEHICENWKRRNWQVWYVEGVRLQVRGSDDGWGINGHRNGSDLKIINDSLKTCFNGCW